ncbi:ribosomal protein L29 [Tritrichomonas foetus]|uniref:Ribosomal protein L29 n=1 Tax=Tritrichomonas foetus TaxID=1144522 RepID=A0A1J4JZE2_9EUKA|nr:ribosomal protein L29 [Tritrichomonas foetus]|eukprot:OHT04529.1 ribosomal protein L29 [Tritrichomonas foetus]
MGHLKAHELAEKNRADLLETLATLEKKLFELRAQIATQSSRQKLSEILTVRRDVARVKTVLMEQQRKALKEKYAEAKHIPKDIRSHEVKARRQQLAPKYANKLTPKAAKRAKFLRPVKFALKAE